MSFAVQVKFVKNTLRLLSLAYAFVPATLRLAKLADAHDGLLGRVYASTGCLNLREPPCADGAGDLVGAPRPTVSTMKALKEHRDAQ